MFLLLLLLCGQVSPDDALRHLLEKEKTATQPSSLTEGQVQKLYDTISAQREEIALLKNQIVAKPSTRRAVEARVGMTLDELKHVPGKLSLTSEDTSVQHYILEIGRVTSFTYGSVQVQDMPAGNGHGPITHSEQVQTGSKTVPEKVEAVDVSVETGLVIKVEVK